MDNDKNILGIMSGTSLDGLDLTICSFWESGKKWIYRIHAAETIPYTENWIRKLNSAPHMSGIDLLNLHQEYGQFLADNARNFIQTSGLNVDLISSHGHTVFHQPEAGFTMQAGDPQVIASLTGITTTGDFRKMDVLLGGQGAPLVPVGDQYLFGEYDFCLNLG
ncbi:MAG: anhydro-N-acetylmuramic acid kinase, partial [Bacteroidales bacterium]|nr:anhydro-N-acetylmuramic acid kinase [Bacteroidales bacterium]